VTGLIVAMRREARPLLRMSLPPDCALVYCGIGLERARAAAASFISAMNPSRLVSFGISGGVEEDLQVADVVISSTVRLLAGPALPLASLSAAELTAVLEAVSARGSKAFLGSIITTRGEAVRPGDVKEMSHPVLDMETYGIAQAAAERGIPLISLRGLSDSFNEPLPFDLAAMTDARGSFRTGRLLAQVLRHPGLLRRLSRLQENTRRAEENVTAAVAALLSSRAALT
jgi:nucleoside phosphorylase